VKPTPYVREPGYALRYRDQRFQSGSGPRTDDRERRALRRLLADVVPPPGPWLDVPSGAGRMSQELPSPVIQADRNPEMLRAIDGREQRACACATALPFRDDTFAGTLCCRLLQHLPAAAERVAVLRELCRVSRGPVLVTFFDRRSLQSLRRAVRRALGKARSGRSSITRAEFQREARAAGLRVVRFVALRRFLAEQTFALCLPDAAT
jgi:ubiquinone/menaquinone biosynthesis C-methylase UbiE